MEEILNEKHIESFEDALTELEAVVKALEDGNVGLEEALHKFEMGVKLSRYCSTKLTEAEKKINILMREEDGAVAVKPANFTEANNE